MRPSILGLIGAAMVIVFGAVRFSGVGANSPAPPGTIAEDSITIQVTDPTVFEILPITGSELGMLLGLGLLLVAAGWTLARGRSPRKDAREWIDAW